jgi:16S rRNA (cytidine1402-2'-O)-methyltransferase
MSGRLVLCATPIGNLEDLTLRARRVLSEAKVLACEDPARTRKLLGHFGIAAPELIVFNEGNESRRAPVLARRIDSGETIVVVSDAGMPGLSDPGYRLVRACVERGIDVEVVPGPTASVTALVLSGLPPGRFVFEGFLPRKQGDRRRKVAELATEPRTIVLYVSPHRLGESLADLLDGLGDRPAALARELTKLHEEVWRSTLAELLAQVAEVPVRGEIVLVVGGAVGTNRPEVASDELARRARQLMQQGVERRAAMGEVARAAGVSKRDVFDALVDADTADRGGARPSPGAR